MDNPMPPSAHLNHVFDPALTTHNHNHGTPMAGIVEESQQQQQNDATTVTAITPGLNPDGTPIKRRPGRPKGSTKKNLLAGSPLPPKLKRPVGRPRKDGLPAGSIAPKVKRERTAVPQQMPIQFPPGMVYPSMPYGFSISAPAPAAPPPPVFQIDPVLTINGDNEWAELARTNPNAFLTTLLVALAAPNPVSSAGPTVEEAFKSHLVSLAPNPQQTQPIPSLYSILKTFWLPSSPAYFSLTASATTARTPSEHRFLYWDPQPLVFNGIACPSCSAPLINKGRISSGPVKVYDIEKPFFIVGCEYVCRSPMCIAATNSQDGRRYASTDSSILRSLPMLLKDEFPARLLSGDSDTGSGSHIWNWKAMGVSTGLWNLVIGALKAGLKKDVILKLIWSVQHKQADTLESSVISSSSQTQQNGQSNGQAEEQNDQDQKMDEDDDDEEEEQDGEGDEADQVTAELTEGATQAQPFTNSFADAFGEAWKENSAIVDTSKKTPPTNSSSTSAASAPAQPPAASATPALTTQPAAQATPQPQLPSQAQAPTTQPPPQLTMTPPTYQPYHTYFPAYPYMHQFVNGQMVPVAVGQQLNPGVTSGLIPNLSASAPNGLGAGVGVGMVTTTGDLSVSHSKRSPRHCCKCGSQDCKGKGGRSFCTNGCQDCGKQECKGRNSRRPDKKCSEGW